MNEVTNEKFPARRPKLEAKAVRSRSSYDEIISIIEEGRKRKLFERPQSSLNGGQTNLSTTPKTATRTAPATTLLNNCQDRRNQYRLLLQI